jgi:hypothetical protein
MLATAVRTTQPCEPVWGYCRPRQAMSHRLQSTSWGCHVLSFNRVVNVGHVDGENNWRHWGSRGKAGSHLHLIHNDSHRPVRHEVRHPPHQTLVDVPSNYCVCKHQANKSPLEPNTKRAPARTSKQAKHSFSPSPSFISILVPPLDPHTPSSVFARWGSEAADRSSQTPQARALAGGWQLAAEG